MKELTCYTNSYFLLSFLKSYTVVKKNHVCAYCNEEHPTEDCTVKDDQGCYYCANCTEVHDSYNRAKCEELKQAEEILQKLEIENLIDIENKKKH
jgi:hypothetical protein